MNRFHHCGNNCCGAEKPEGHEGRALTFHECVGKYMCLYTLVRRQAVSVWGGAGVAPHEGSFPSTMRAMELSQRPDWRNQRSVRVSQSCSRPPALAPIPLLCGQLLLQTFQPSSCHPHQVSEGHS